jgi:hypothetical protein
MAADSMLLSIVSGLGFLVRLGIEVTLLIVALTTVRTRRPEAAPMLVAASGTQIFGTLVAYGLNFFLARLPYESADKRMLGYAVVQASTMMLALLGGVLLLLGIFKLAQAPQTASTDPGRYQ